MKSTVFYTLFLATSLMGLPALAQDAPRPSGELIAMNCGTCHGTNGQVFTDSMPPLAGMKVDSFVNAMIAFRDNKRPNTIMSRLAPAFTEDDYRAIAEYFAAQEPVPYDVEMAK